MGDLRIYPALAHAKSWGEVPASTDGKTIPSGGGANTKGSWVEFITAANNVEPITGCMLIPLSEEASDFLLDVGAGATPDVIIPNIYLGLSAGGAYRGPYIFNVRLPTGQQIRLRCQAASSSITVDVVFYTLHGGEGCPAFDWVQAVGANTGTSQGTQIESGDDVMGSWYELGTLTRAARGFYVALGDPGNTSQGFYLDIGIGAESSELVIVENFYLSRSSAPDMVQPSFFWVPIELPAGKRIAARAQTDGSVSGVANDLFVAVYAVG